MSSLASVTSDECLFFQLLNEGELIKEATEAPLRDLFFHLITVLLDERLNSVADGPQVIRSINVMVVKLVERTDHTACLLALIRLLRDCVGSQNCSGKFLELVMKVNDYNFLIFCGHFLNLLACCSVYGKCLECYRPMPIRSTLIDYSLKCISSV